MCCARCAGWRDGKPRALDVEKQNFLAQKQVMRAVLRICGCIYIYMLMPAVFSRGRACKQGDHAHTQVASELQPPPPKGWAPRPRSKNAPKPAALVSYGDNDGEVSSRACFRAFSRMPLLSAFLSPRNMLFPLPTKHRLAYTHAHTRAHTHGCI